MHSPLEESGQVESGGNVGSREFSHSGISLPRALRICGCRISRNKQLNNYQKTPNPRGAPEPHYKYHTHPPHVNSTLQPPPSFISRILTSSLLSRMFATKALRQAAAAAHAERTPMIKFLGKHTIPCKLAGESALFGP